MDKFLDMQGKQLKVGDRVVLHSKKNELTIGQVVKLNKVRVVVRYSGPKFTNLDSPAEVFEESFETIRLIRLK